MSKFAFPQEVKGLHLAFGGDMSKLLPPMHSIPQDFQNGTTKWNDLVSTWFFRGLKSFDCVPKEGIDKAAALKHISAIMRSWDPKHEHKEAGCAYLLSLWFEKPEYESN
ncbi:hypothetical protein D3C86_1309310 [compost metagenome]